MSGPRGAIVVALLGALPSALAAQHVVVGPQVVFGDYREVSADLHFRGSGGGVAGAFTWKKLAVEASFASITYKPSGGTATQSFKAKQFDLRVRYYVAGPVSAELGVVNRKAEPEFEAQSAGAVRGGVDMSYLLGPGVHMGVRGGMLFGAKFSGGGTSSPVGALELGLSLNVEGMRGRGRLLVDYDFQRIARTTGTGPGEVHVPIQQSLGRVGIALAF